MPIRTVIIVPLQGLHDQIPTLSVSKWADLPRRQAAS